MRSFITHVRYKCETCIPCKVTQNKFSSLVGDVFCIQREATDSIPSASWRQGQLTSSQFSGTKVGYSYIHGKKAKISTQFQNISCYLTYLLMKSTDGWSTTTSACPCNVALTSHHYIRPNCKHAKYEIDSYQHNWESEHFRNSKQGEEHLLRIATSLLTSKISIIDLLDCVASHARLDKVLHGPSSVRQMLCRWQYVVSVSRKIVDKMATNKYFDSATWPLEQGNIMH